MRDPVRLATLLLAALLLLGCRLGAAVEHANGPNAAAIAQGEQKNTQDADAAGAQPASSAATSGRLAAAAIAASHLQQDDSVRCRLSGICEGPEPDCSEDGSSSSRPSEAGQPDPLACLTADADRAAAVQAAARHAWSGYRDCAWGEDELLPLTCSGGHWLNLSLTMVDSLDTLYLLGLNAEFEEAARWLEKHLDVGAPGSVNLFETTIRILGGLLSAQALSADSHPGLSRALGEKAAELGARLLPAFDSPSGVPYSDVDLRTGHCSMPAWGTISSLSEISSVSLEFTYLARITGHSPFEAVPLSVHERLEKAHNDGGGLLGQYFNPLTGKAHRSHASTITLGARSDSYYEYLLKQWLLTGKTEDWLRERYVHAMQSVRGRLLKRTAPAGRPGLWYLAEEGRRGKLSSKMDHLVCFLPGLLALGDFHGVSTQRPYAAAAAGSSSSSSGEAPSDGQEATAAAAAAAATAAAAAAEGKQQQMQAAYNPHGPAGGQDVPDLQLAAELALTCYELYRRTPTGLAPEIAHFANNTEGPLDFPNKHVHDVGHGDFTIKPKDAHSLLRPEAVESFYLLWKTTGDPQYQQWAWQVFRALEKWARVRPADRDHVCATCQAQAAYEAAEAATAAAAAQAAGEEGGGAAAAAVHKPVAVAAGRVQLEKGPGMCSSCSSSGGYSSLESVLQVPPVRRDKMESFYMAETLKYLYLIFAEPPDRCLHPSCQASSATGQPQQQHVDEQQGKQGKQRLLPLDRFVFTTEAHALPVVGPAGASRVAQVFVPERRVLQPFENVTAADDGSASASASASASTQQQGQQQPVPAAAEAAAAEQAAEAASTAENAAEL